MAALLRLAQSPYPLPLGSLAGKRSLLSVENLLDAVAHLLAVPCPLRRPLIVADEEPLSAGEIVAAMRRGVGRAPRLVPVPSIILKAVLVASGRSGVYDRLAGSLVVDSSRLRALGWSPSVTTPAGLAALSKSVARG